MVLNLLKLLSQAVDEYNGLQEDDAKRLDWWNDVIDNISDTNDEKEITTAIQAIRNEIQKLK